MTDFEETEFPFSVVLAGPELLREDEALGVREFLERLAKDGVRCAYVSAEPGENADALIATTGLGGMFAAVVGSEDVGQGFPAPDLFIAAGRRLGVGCWRCIAICASPMALAAARRCGCQVLALGAAAAASGAKGGEALEEEEPEEDGWELEGEASAEGVDKEDDFDREWVDAAEERDGGEDRSGRTGRTDQTDLTNQADREDREDQAKRANQADRLGQGRDSGEEPEGGAGDALSPDGEARGGITRLEGLTPHRLRTLFFSPAKTLYADVAVDLPVRATYTYRVPQGIRSEARVGSIVRVPVRGREARGVIVRLGLQTAAPKRKLKPVAQVLTPEYAIPDDLLALGQWMSDYYLGGPGETLGAISFFGLQDEKPRTERVLALSNAVWERVKGGEATASPEAVGGRESRQEQEESERVARAEKEGEIEYGVPRLNGVPRLTARQRQVVRFFVETLNEPITRAELSRREGCSAGVIAALLNKKVLAEGITTVEREDAYGKPVAVAAPHLLNAEQKAACESILGAINERRFEPFLLYGITGSGKTEVYLQAIARVLEMGRQAIVLVPEISLTPQAVERFRSRFGARVGVYHSQLSRGQKYDLWRRIDRGDVRVLIGARSGLFAPFPDLGLIVVDEEHEHSYKQSDYTPRYHARDVAIWRARFVRIPVVLGSATPSLESYYNARQGRYTLLRLTERVGAAQLPALRLVDMGAQVRETRDAGALSLPLRAGIAERLEKGEQVILFLNRRGFSSFLLCMVCKATVRCEHCDMVMTWHKAVNQMMCHLCGDTKPRPKDCPSCGAPDPHPMGFGTQRIEEEVREMFPRARLLRIDYDTTRGRHGFLRMWEEIEKGKADILLGTQMIAKGLHLENVTLVGVISADNALFLPDFRAAERTFAQLTQVAGRAGRMSRAGEVVIQTFVPHYYPIQRAVAQDAEGFYAQELHMRDLLQFPPHWRLLLVRFTGANAERVIRQAHVLGKVLRDRIECNDGYRSLSILGPAPSPIGRIEDEIRWQLLIRGQKPTLMRRLLEEGLADYHSDPHRRGVTLTFDMDPMDLL